MTAEHTIPVDQWPNPVCTFGESNETRVIETVNTSFERAFGTPPAHQPVAVALESLGLRPESMNSSFEALFSDERELRVEMARQSTSVDGTVRYRAQTVPPHPDGTGHIVFTPLSTESGLTAHGPIDIDHVASVISHDLRNPLDVAKAHLRAGRDITDNDHFAHVAQAHERMDRIIQDVLTLARGSDIVDPDEPVDLGNIVTTAWETVETDNATLVVDESLPTTIADSDRVTRLFENLFRNAVEHGSTIPDSQDWQDTVEHGSQGGVADGDDDTDSDESPVNRGSGKTLMPEHEDLTVRVGCLDTAATDGIFVADDGRGIQPEHRDRVFEPGYSSDEHGTGLGLAIVVRIATLHDWEINVTTSRGGGAKFEITGIESI